MADRKKFKSKKSFSRSDSPDVQLSKSLSWLLRHGAEKEGFVMNDNGYLLVEDILKHKTFKKYTQTDIERVVENNDKQRFHLCVDPSTNGLQIRANQGHTVEVQDLELTQIEDATTEPLVVHGTYMKNLENIKINGLSRMKRNHIHFSSAFPGDGKTISGIRNSCNVFIVINLDKALRDGLKFYKSANGVILCPGNEEGFLLPKYFSKIIPKNELK